MTTEKVYLIFWRGAERPIWEYFATAELARRHALSPEYMGAKPRDFDIVEATLKYEKPPMHMHWIKKND